MGQIHVAGDYRGRVEFSRRSDVNQGSAYVFAHSEGAWTQQQQLTGINGAAGARFGSSTAVSGNTVVVGAHHDFIGANSNQGSAYVFVRK